MGRQTLFLCLVYLLWQGHSLPHEDDPKSLKHSTSTENNSEQLQSASIEKIESSACKGSENKTGRCEYLNKCLTEEYRSNFSLAMNHRCTIDRTYVGICCSNAHQKTDDSEISSVSVFPIIAENRGWIEEKVPRNVSRIVWKKEDEDGDEDESEHVSENTVGDRQRSRGCGTTSRTLGRIVGGRPADPNKWPWIAALLVQNVQFCAGVLITDRHVLTAAHCMETMPPQHFYRIRKRNLQTPGRNYLHFITGGRFFKANLRDIKVRLGEYDLTKQETGSIDFNVAQIRIHPSFSSDFYNNDIAIVKMHRPTPFNDHIWPVCLPPIDQTFENKNAVVAGWGTSNFGGPTSTVLMEVAVPIWPREKCVQRFVQRLPKTVICAGAYEGGRDACQGDSGGPLLHQLPNGRWVIVGIVSQGIRCGEQGLPGIYTRVNSYLEWIFQNAVF